MEEFRQILRDAVEVLRIRKIIGRSPALEALDSAYNKALDDVLEQVINKIPN